MKDTTRKKITKWFWVLITAPVVLIFILLCLVWIFAKIPSFEELENPDSKLATQVIAADGEILTTFHIENRTYASYDELAPSLVQAAVATEDKRFYKHSGIDMIGLGRVFFKTLLMTDTSQGGGSTITQQLAKTLYPRREVKSRIPGWSKVVMVWTKLKEWITAEKIKIAVGAVIQNLDEEPEPFVARGPNLMTAHPVEATITYQEIAHCLDKSIAKIETSILHVLEQTPPELYSDIVENGIFLSGGGALLRGLAKRFSEKVNIPFHVAEDPLHSVARGTCIALKNTENYSFLMR